MHDRRAQYIANYDGDSVVMMLDQDFYDTKTINIRLANVWAPELREPGGVEVREFVRTWFRAYDVQKWGFRVITHKTKTDREVMTLGRYVADITTVDGRFCLNSDVMRFIVEENFTGGIGSIVRNEASSS